MISSLPSTKKIIKQAVESMIIKNQHIARDFNGKLFASLKTQVIAIVTPTKTRGWSKILYLTLRCGINLL